MEERTSPVGAAPPTGVRSPRLRLARLAYETALAAPGVLDTDAGPTGLHCTVGGGERLPGVTCVAAPGGGYDVSLRLVCELVPLRPLGDRVRDAVQTVGAEAGVEVASVTIEITGVRGPDES